MAFDPVSTRTPTSIGELEIVLRTNPATGEQSASYQFDVLDQDGKIIRRYNGDLVPHITQGQIAALLDFMADLRTLAEQVLP